MSKELKRQDEAPATAGFRKVVAGVVGIPVGVIVGTVVGAGAAAKKFVESGGDVQTSGEEFADVLDNCVKGTIDIVHDNAAEVAGTVASAAVALAVSDADKRNRAADKKREDRKKRTS